MEIDKCNLRFFATLSRLGRVETRQVSHRRRTVAGVGERRQFLCGDRDNILAIGDWLGGVP